MRIHHAQTDSAMHRHLELHYLHYSTLEPSA